MRILVDHGAYENLGDSAMLEGAVSRLTNILPDAEIFVIARARLKSGVWDFPKVFKQTEYDVKLFWENLFSTMPFFWRFNDYWQRISYKLTLSSIGMFASAVLMPLSDRAGNKNGKINFGKFCEPFDALHIAGGGYFADFFYGEVLNKCGLIHAFSEQGKPVILTGQQMGPFRSHIAKKAMLKALNRVNFIGIRDPFDSLEFCKESHLSSERFDIMGDDSLVLPGADNKIIDGMLSDLGLEPDKFIAINFRISKSASENINHLQKFADISDELAKSFNMPLLLVPISLNPANSDVKTGEKITDIVKVAKVSVLNKDSLTPASVKGLLGKAYGAVGVSHHFCTFSLSQGVPAVCLYDGDYFSQKARGICGFWQDDRFALSLKDIDTDYAVNHISQVFGDENLRGKLNLLTRNAIKQWRAIFDKQVRKAFGNLK